MKMTNSKNKLSFIVCIVLIAAMALVTTGCNGKNIDSGNNTQSTILIEDGKTYGKGETSVSLTVADSDGEKISCTILTNKKTVGDALSELGIIAGEEGQYGIYIKTVNGKTYDFEKDGKYWAFYVNGEYAQKGIDKTEIDEDAVYMLKVE